MKRYFSFLVIIILFIAYSPYLFAQTVEDKYLRPSMTILYLEDNDQTKKDILKAIIKSSDELKSGISTEKFDKLPIGVNKISIPNLPSRPKAPVFDESKQDVVSYALEQIAYKKELKKYNEILKSELTKKAQELSKNVIRAMFNVDQNGNMSDELLRSRGFYSATDADVIKDRASQISRLSNIWFRLIERSYIVIYTIDDFNKIDKAFYDEKDRLLKASHDILVKKGLKTGDYTPVIRLEEGYNISYSASIFKISKSWFDSFFDLYWVTKESSLSERSNKIQAFNNAIIPVEFQRVDEGTYNAFDSYGSNAPMDKLFANTAQSIQEEIFFKSSKKVSELASKASITQAYPILVKLGTKEDIYVGERFFVYEKEKKSESANEKSKLVGVIRAVSPIANNKENATGNSATTKFIQVSGKKIYPGMTIVQKEDRNIKFGGEYYVTKSGSGVGFSFEFDWSSSKTLGVTLRNTRGPNGLYIGVEMLSVPNNDIVGISVAKEIYLLKSGNLFLYPKIGIGYNLDNEVPSVNPSVALGWNISPWLVLMGKVKPFNNSYSGIGIQLRF